MIWPGLTSITLAMLVLGHLAVGCIETARDELLAARARCIADLALVALFRPGADGRQPLALVERACAPDLWFQVTTPDGRQLAGSVDGPPFERGWASQGLRHYDLTPRGGRRYRVATALRRTPQAPAPYFEVHVTERQPAHDTAVWRGLLVLGQVALVWLITLAALDLRRRSRGQSVLAGERRVLAHAAHELRTSLAVLAVQLQAGLRGETGAERVMHDMNRTLHRALATSERVLGQARTRPEAGGEPCRLDAVLEDVALALAPLLADKDIALTFRAAPLLVPGPEWCLWEIFSNLMTNAIRHAPAGGGIVLRAAVATADVAQVRIWNSGPPLDPARCGGHFARFDPGPGGSGVGLGLALCAEHLRWLQGSILLRNRRLGGHAGVEARVRLPLRAPPEMTAMHEPVSRVAAAVSGSMTGGYRPDPTRRADNGIRSVRRNGPASAG